MDAERGPGGLDARAVVKVNVPRKQEVPNRTVVVVYVVDGGFPWLGNASP